MDSLCVLLDRYYLLFVNQGYWDFMKPSKDLKLKPPPNDIDILKQALLSLTLWLYQVGTLSDADVIKMDKMLRIKKRKK